MFYDDLRSKLEGGGEDKNINNKRIKMKKVHKIRSE